MELAAKNGEMVCVSCNHDRRDHGRRGCLVILHRHDGVYISNRASMVLCDCTSINAHGDEP